VIGIDVFSHNSNRRNIDLKWVQLNYYLIVAMPIASSRGFFLQVVTLEGVMLFFEFEACIIEHEVNDTRFTIKPQKIAYITL